MSLQIKKNDLYLCFYFILFTFFVSYKVANRDLFAVDDTIVYVQNFLYRTSLNDFHYEFLFDFLTFIIRWFTSNYIVYFFILNVILNSILFFLTKKVAKIANINEFYFSSIFFSFCFFSSWYYVAAANGLRQGLSLAFLYLFFIYFSFNKNKIFSFLFLLCSIFFHYSSILILPFIILIKLSLNKLFILIVFFGLLYFLGINEKIVLFISNITGIPLYASIKDYIEDVDAYRYGFQLDLFLYSFILSCIFYFFSNYFFINNLVLRKLVKIYYVLLLPYLFFGFAAFSNRYGLFAWFFSILLNSFICYLLFSVKKYYFILGFFCLYILSILYFIVVY